MTDEVRHIQVLMGPYRDHRLTVSASDADAAINDHWAVDPNHVLAPDEEPHPPLSEEERTHALEAAQAWAQLQWDTAQGIAPPDPPPPEARRETETRDMHPEGDDPAGNYTTREHRRRR